MLSFDFENLEVSTYPFLEVLNSTVIQTSKSSLEYTYVHKILCKEEIHHKIPFIRVDIHYTC